MTVRRVVTGHDSEGKSVFASDETVDGVRFSLMPGLELHTLWASDCTPTYPDTGSPLPASQWFPRPGGFRFFRMSLPPDDAAEPEIADVAAAVAEAEAKVPGLLAAMEPEDPGMHTTDTVDFLYVLEGTPVLELDDGAEVQLNPGDTVIQSGTRHRWHNRTAVPCLFVGALLGAHRARDRM